MRDRRAIIRQARAVASAFPLPTDAAPPSFATPREELRFKLEEVKKVVQRLIDLIDDIEGDADLEAEEDVCADDLGEEDAAA